MAANDVAIQRLQDLVTRRTKAVNERLMGLEADVAHTREAVDRERREIVRVVWIVPVYVATGSHLPRYRYCGLLSA